VQSLQRSVAAANPPWTDCRSPDSTPLGFVIFDSLPPPLTRSTGRLFLRSQQSSRTHLLERGIRAPSTRCVGVRVLMDATRTTRRLRSARL